MKDRQTAEVASVELLSTIRIFPIRSIGDPTVLDALEGLL